jgi:hypothetical protein
VQRRPNGQAACAKAAEVIRLDAEGLQRTEIARRLQIGIASVYRILTVARMGAVEREVAACTSRGCLAGLYSPVGLTRRMWFQSDPGAKGPCVPSV